MKTAAKKCVSVVKLASQICKKGQIALPDASVTAFHDSDSEQVGLQLYFSPVEETVRTASYLTRNDLPPSLQASFPIRDFLFGDPSFDHVKFVMTALNEELSKMPWRLLPLEVNAVADALAKEGVSGVSEVKVLQTVKICFTLYIPQLRYTTLTRPIPLGKIFFHSELAKMLAAAKR